MAIIAPEVTPEPTRLPQEESQANAATFGGGPGLEQIGNEMGNIAKTGARIAINEKIKADQSAVEEAVGSKLSPALTKMTYDPDSGALARISRSTSVDDALKIQKETLDDYDRTAKDIASKLKGQDQIAGFNKHAFIYGDNLNRTLMAHVDQHVKQQDEKSFNSFVDNSISQAALSYGDESQRKTLLSMMDDHAIQFAKRNGMDSEQLKDIKSRINSGYHSAIIDQMLNDGQDKMANGYFNENKSDITDLKVRDNIERNLEVVPKQKEELAKHQQEETYKANMKQSMLDMFDGKLTLSEAQRRFRDGQLDKSDYDLLEGKLSKPDAEIIRATEISEPGVFNQIRKAQLSDSNTPGEIQRMIAGGAADGKISPTDGKYLLSLTSEMPPNPRDRMIESHANNLRDFGNRYFSETNIFGFPTNKEKTSQETEGMVSDFYKAVDSSKATGDQVQEIRNQIKKTAMQKRFPGLGNLDNAPDVVVNVKGQVIRLLNPDERSNLKAKYKITPTESQKVEDQ